MKRRLHFLLLIFACLISQAQVPLTFKYQAVARDGSGNILANRNVSFRISILQSSTSGTTIYSESHAKTTNPFGLVELEIGNGTPSLGFFASINWITNKHFIKMEIDPNGGNAYQLMGISQLLSVPYAIYAKTAENVTGGAPPTGAAGGDLSGIYPNPLIGDGKVTSAKILDGSVSNADLASDAVTSAKIADGTLTNADLANGSVNSAKIADATITAADIADNTVTVQKISSSGATANEVILFNGTNVSWGDIHGTLLRTTLINVSNGGLGSVSTTYVKIADLGVFTKVETNSLVEAVFEGRIAAATMSGTGMHFEIRVDGNPPSLGRARAVLRSVDAGYYGVPVSITGIFTGLGTGSHTISMWAKTSSGSATDATVDPGNFGADHVIVKEYRN